MRALVTAVVMMLAWGVSVSAQERLSFDSPDDVVQMMRKIWCSQVDGETVVFYWEGDVYSRRIGERDKKLFSVEGMNIRQCGAHEDDAFGAGAKTTSREILLYLDPETKEVLTDWENPWTGETVDVLHVANDPVNGGFYPVDRSGEPTQWQGVVLGDQWSINFTIPLYYPNPLASGYQDAVGPPYHATEMFSFFGGVDALTDPDVNNIPTAINWVRLSQWLPWMKMGAREGVLYFSTTGRKLDNFDQMSETMKAEIAAHYPEYASAPPLDDARANMTSWKYYKGVVDGDIQPPQRGGE